MKKEVFPPDPVRPVIRSEDDRADFIVSQIK